MARTRLLLQVSASEAPGPRLSKPRRKSREVQRKEAPPGNPHPVPAAAPPPPGAMQAASLPPRGKLFKASANDSCFLGSRRVPEVGHSELKRACNCYGTKCKLWFPPKRFPNTRGPPFPHQCERSFLRARAREDGSDRHRRTSLLPRSDGAFAAPAFAHGPGWP